ncbi:MAG: Crp/Fnr family transcriptional regulator [Syntrophorhabdaceae bacterium]|nr:Crp/Fnr family transcriptional regulator [Syntrophorhabdaceae bacterium]
MRVHDFLTNTPLFQGLPEPQVDKLTRIVTEHSFAGGQVIFAEGDKADGFYIVVTGRVKIYKLSPEGKEQILHVFGPGEPFAEVAMFSGGTLPAHAEAIKESRVVFVPRTAFVALIQQDPSIAMNMFGTLSIRLKRFTSLIEDLSLKEVPQRLAAYLLYLANEKKDHEHVELTISKGQLASLLGTIPETLSRILRKMSAQGCIATKGRTIELRDRRALESLAAGERSLL